MSCGAKEFASFFPPDCNCGVEKSWMNTKAHLEKRHIVKASDCDSKPFKRIKSESEDLDRLLDGGWPLGFSAMIWGQPGSGKSRLAYRWASQMKPALIFLWEYGPAPRCYTLANHILLHCGGDSKDVHFSNDRENWEKYADKIKPRSIVYDSISVLPNPIEILKQITKWVAKNNAFAWAISHATKNNDAVGLNTLQHEPDATLIIKRTPFNTAKVIVEKSRFCGPGWINLPIVGGIEKESLPEIQPYVTPE